MPSKTRKIETMKIRHAYGNTPPRSLTDSMPFTLIELLVACHPKFREARRRTIRFTLIELLVVIAIIAILASLLLPSLKKAKDVTYTRVCTNNEKQLFTALLLYAEDHGDNVTPSWDGTNRWYYFLGPVSGYSSACGYLSTDKSFLCPAISSMPYPRYGINQNFGVGQITDTRLWRNTSVKVLVADSTGISVGAWDRWRWNADPDGLDGRHSLGANILYADGHVDWVGRAQKPHDLIDTNSWRMDR